MNVSHSSPGNTFPQMNVRAHSSPPCPSAQRRGRSQDRQNNNAEVCQLYLQGICNKGDRCSYWHSGECKFYPYGTCTAGQFCSFLHPGAYAPYVASVTAAVQEAQNHQSSQQINQQPQTQPPRNFCVIRTCLLYTSPSPRDQRGSRMPSSA